MELAPPARSHFDKSWVTAKLPDSIVPLRNRVLDRLAQKNLTMTEKREYLKEYYRLSSQKKQGGLPKPHWEDFKSSDAGFTDDVLEEALLQDYPSLG